MNEPSKQARWAWLPSAIGVGVAILLGATVAFNYMGVRRARSSVARGQAGLMFQTIIEALRRGGRPPTADDLEAILKDNSKAGLRYLGLSTGKGSRIEAGIPLRAGVRLPVRLRVHAPHHRRHLQDLGERIRVTTSLPAWRRRRPHRWPGSRRPGVIVFEYEPTLARGLETEAARTLWFGTAAAALFLLLAAALHRTLRERERLNRELERGRRLSALGEMSAVLAHELRNPLASLKGHAQLLEESMPPASAERERVTRIVGEAARLESLTTDLLRFVKSGQLHLRQVAVEELVDGAVESMGGAQIKRVLSKAPPQVTVDPDRIQEVLQNLLSNACQATPDKGPAPEIHVEQREAAVVFSVRDFGPGIAPEARERIFEPFVTDKTRGTGLGLAIARRIVELHGGSIAARSHQDGGAVFEFSLPGVAPDGSSF